MTDSNSIPVTTQVSLHDLVGISEDRITAEIREDPHGLEAVADIKCGCWYKRCTPLLACCVRGYVKKQESWAHVFTLLELGANVNATDSVCKFNLYHCYLCLLAYCTIVTG